MTFPSESVVTGEDVLYLTPTGQFRLPITPPPLDNHGNHIVSISKLVRWLGEKVEEKGAFLLPEFAGRELLFEGDRVAGVRGTDRGVDKHGNPRVRAVLVEAAWLLPRYQPHYPPLARWKWSSAGTGPLLQVRYVRSAARAVGSAA